MKNQWHKPTEKEKLDEANKHYNLQKSKHKRIDWWDKVKISIYEHEAIEDAEYKEVKPLQLPYNSDK